MDSYRLSEKVIELVSVRVSVWHRLDAVEPVVGWAE